MTVTFPAYVPDKSGLLQYPRGDIHCCPPDAEHMGKKFLRQREGIFVRPIMSHQQPPGATLLHAVEAFTRGRMKYLPYQSIQVLMNQSFHLGPPLDYLSEHVGLNPKCRTRCLDQIQAERPLFLNNLRRAYNSFFADHDHLHLGLAVGSDQ